MSGKNTISSLNVTWCSGVGGVYVCGSTKKMGDHFSLNFSTDLLNNFGLDALSSCVCFPEFVTVFRLIPLPLNSLFIR